MDALLARRLLPRCVLSQPAALARRACSRAHKTKQKRRWCQTHKYVRVELKFQPARGMCTSLLTNVNKMSCRWCQKAHTSVCAWNFKFQQRGFRPRVAGRGRAPDRVRRPHEQDLHGVRRPDSIILLCFPSFCVCSRSFFFALDRCGNRQAPDLELCRLSLSWPLFSFFRKIVKQ